MKINEKRKNELLNRYGAWALVTGASSGIGKSLVHLLADCGFNIILTARNEDKLSEIANTIEKTQGIKAVHFKADLSNHSDVDSLLEFSHQFEIGLVINSAGFGISGEMTEHSTETELEMLQLNVVGLFKITNHFARKFKEKKKGGIILLSSAASFQGMPYLTHYSATKAYVQSLGEGLYHELKKYNVDILCASPGPVATNFAERANMRMEVAMSADKVAGSILKSLGNKGTVIPGFTMNFLMFALKLMPRRWQVKFMASLNRRMVST